jgi:hypothetical protein
MSDELLQRSERWAGHLEFIEAQCEVGRRGFSVEDCEPGKTAQLLRDLIAEVERLRTLVPPSGWVQDGGKIVAEVREKTGE